MDRLTLETVRKGADVGRAFTTEYAPDDLRAVAITSIIIGEERTYIGSLQVKYSDGYQTRRYGSQKCKTNNIELDSDEWIVRIEGSWKSNSLNNLSFISNKEKTYGPYGTTMSSDTFIWKPVQPGFGALWMSGYYEDLYINSLQVTFAEYPGTRTGEAPAFLKYEASTRSVFFKQLVSPIVTLHVGTPSVEIAVHEDVVCKLPFFQAALHGSFLEASSKTIKLPEDDPAIIAALIEFLTNGVYTYSHNSLTISSSSTSSPPTGDLEQGLFHLKLYASAVKYDCEALRKAALQSLQFVMTDLHGADALKIWQEAYGYGMSIRLLGTVDVRTVRKTMEKLYGESPQVVAEMVEETPALANDLLRLLIIKK